MNVLKNIAYRYDYFSTSVSLRNSGSPIVVNLCTGLFSFVLYILFIYLLVDTVRAILSLERISSTQTTKVSENLEQTIQNITVGVGLQGKNLLALQHIFTVKAFVSPTSSASLGGYEIPIVPCSRDMWSQIDQVRYDSLNLQNGLCLDKSLSRIKGAQGIITSDSIYISLGRCDNATSPVVCDSPANIAAYFSNTANYFQGKFLAFSIYIMNSGINPSGRNPFHYTVDQKNLWLLFNDLQQVFTQIFLSKIKVSTDTSYFPWTTTQKVEGYEASQTVSSVLVNSVPSTYFIQAFIVGSAQEITVSKKLGKLTQALGFTGGLLGLIVSFFAIFFGSYNYYCSLISVGERIFNFKKNQCPKVANFHFGKYLKYCIYDWVKFLFCYELKWQDCQITQKVMSEANNQLELNLILSKLNRLDKGLVTLIGQNFQALLYLSEGNTIEQSEVKRRKAQYYEKFIHGSNYTTIQNFEEDVLNTTNEDLMQLGNSIMPSSFIEMNPNVLKNQKYNSLRLMNEYVKKYVEKFNINEKTFQLTEQEQEVQQQFAKAFFEASQEARNKVIRNIPLGILYRFYLYRMNTKQLEILQVPDVQSQLNETKQNILDKGNDK